MTSHDDPVDSALADAAPGAAGAAGAAGAPGAADAADIPDAADTELTGRSAPRQWTSVVPVWLAAALGAVLVAVYASPERYFTWLPIVLAVATLLSFCIQLAMQRKEGLVLRIASSLTGAVVVLSVATAILAPLAVVQGAVPGQ